MAQERNFRRETVRGFHWYKGVPYWYGSLGSVQAERVRVASGNETQFGVLYTTVPNGYSTRRGAAYVSLYQVYNATPEGGSVADAYFDTRKSALRKAAFRRTRGYNPETDGRALSIVEAAAIRARRISR